MTRLPDLPDDELAAWVARAERELPDAPPAAIAAAVALWRRRTLAEVVSRLVAVLRFDSAAAPASLSYRSWQDERQLLFSAGDVDIDLRIVAAAAPGAAGVRYAVTGQVLGPGAQGVVSASPAGARAQETPLDGFGEFTLADLPAGPLQLSIRFADRSIELPPFELGGP